jgi:hypothetical protein
MNPLEQGPKYEPNPLSVVSNISAYIDRFKQATTRDSQFVQLQKSRGTYIPKIPVKTPFPSVTCVIGKIGSGKSTRLKRFAEQYFEEGHCVIDLCDFGGFENACYALPNMSHEVFNHFNAILLASGKQPVYFQPRAYPMIMYIPATRGIENTMPNFFRPFRIAFQTLEFNEFITLCGFQSGDVASELLEMAWASKPPNEGFEDFVKRAIEMCGYGSLQVEIEGRSRFEVQTAEKRSFPPLLRKLKVLWDVGLICDEGDPLALDLNALMLDTKHIHAFSMGYIDRLDIPYLIYGYIIRRMYNLRKNPRNHYPKMSLIAREAQKLAPYQVEFPGQEISRACIRAICRECRHLSLWLYLDTQDHIQLDYDVRRRVFSWYIFLSDKLIVDSLRKIFYLKDTVAYAIPKLPVGLCAIQHKTYAGVPALYLPPLSHVKAYQEKFLELWDRRGTGMKTWDIEFPDSNSIIRFEVPNAMDTPLGKRETTLVYKYLNMLKKLLARYNGEIKLSEYADIIGLDPDYCLQRVVMTTEFADNFYVDGREQLIKYRKGRENAAIKHDVRLVRE